MPTPGKSNALIWINFQDKNLILDCGEGASLKLLQHNMDDDYLDAVIITHNHADHLSGLIMVIQMLHIQKRKKQLLVFLPEGEIFFLEMLSFFYLFPAKLSYPLIIRNICDIKNYYPEISLLENNHLAGYCDLIREAATGNKMKAYSILLNVQGVSALYSSDLNELISLEPYLDDLDLLILDGLHPSAAEIISLPQRTRAAIILNHGLSTELKKRLMEREDHPFILADETQEIEL